MFTEKIITKIGYIEATIPFAYYNQLLQNINENPPTELYNKSLAGQIENEKKIDFNLFPQEIKNIIFDGCVKYIDTFGHDFFIKNVSLKHKLQFLNIWINFQKSGEYNPIHNHTGDLVFVTWLQIPYDLNEEQSQPSCIHSNFPVASKFQFTNITNPYTDKINNLLDIDKSYEGKIIIFHADMYHLVYPFFTSDKYRISVSGNLRIMPDED